MEARLTLSGMLKADPYLFDNMQLPTPPTAANIGMEAAQIRAAWTIDKTTLINYISMRSASMSLVFPDMGYMRMAIHTWSAMHLENWQRLFNTWFFKYNPLWNKDGKFNTTTTDIKTGSGESSAESESSTTGENTHFVHGYDSNTVTTPDSLTWTHSDRDNTSADAENSASGSYENSERLEHRENRTEQGNIGVTTTQQMIKEERESAMFNLYDVIAESFIRFFCIAIY